MQVCEYWQAPGTETKLGGKKKAMHNTVFKEFVPEVEAKKKVLPQLVVPHPLNSSICDIVARALSLESCSTAGDLLSHSFNALDQFLNHPGL